MHVKDGAMKYVSGAHWKMLWESVCLCSTEIYLLAHNLIDFKSHNPDCGDHGFYLLRWLILGRPSGNGIAKKGFSTLAWDGNALGKEEVLSTIPSRSAVFPFHRTGSL